MATHGLLFRFQDLIDECETLKVFARDFLDPQSTWVLDNAKSTLENFQASSRREIRWETAPKSLFTNWSVGESQPDSRSGYRVRAHFSFVWDISKIDSAARPKQFLLHGLASTTTTITDEIDGQERTLASWNLDVGDHASPGTHFHFQVQGPDTHRPPFPKSLDVPRLPAPLMSPFLAIDMALGELFQDRWKAWAASENQHSRRWRGIHRERLQRFFRWQASAIENCPGSPWMALKLAKPHRDMLVSK